MSTPLSTFAYIYNKSANAWREVSNMAEPRKDHSCGLVQSYFGPEVMHRNRGSFSIFDSYLVGPEIITSHELCEIG